MPDQLNEVAGRGSRRRDRLPGWLVVVLQVAAILVLFAAVGAACGLLWSRLWDPPSGVVQDGVWFTDEQGLRDQFTGTGLYVVVGVGAGIVCGAVCALLLDRAEVVTLLAVVAGAALAAWLMRAVGVHDSPPDPRDLAASAPDGTTLPGHLEVSGLSPLLAFPAGALLSVLTVFGVGPRGARGARKQA